MPLRPNIIWVLADQMRGQAMGCAGDGNVRTPNLDALAAGGVRFSAACSTYPVCVPFRFSVLTGEYAHTRWVPALSWRMSPAERTIAHDLNDAGYETAYVGKWHLNGSVPLRDPRSGNRVPVRPGYRGGFQVWHAFNLRNGYFDTCCFHGDDPTPVPLGKYQTDGLFDIAVDYVRAQAGAARPFFMVLALEAPHPPHEAPPEYVERVRARTLAWLSNFHPAPPRDETKPPFWCHLDAKEIPELPIHYYAQIENLDDNVGRLVSAVDAAGLTDNTVLIFMSDHGEMLGSHGLYQKQFPYEESVNIPFIVRDPWLPAGRRGTVMESPICTEDIHPTTLALAGLTPRAPKPGAALASHWREGVELAREGVYLEFVEEDRPFMVYYRSAWRGLRTRRHKYTTLDGKPWELFDLAEDPYEMRNLIESPAHAGLRARLHEELKRRGRETQDDYAFSD